MGGAYYELVELMRKQGAKSGARSTVVCGDVTVTAEPFAVSYSIFGEAGLPVKLSVGIDLAKCAGEYIGIFFVADEQYILMSLSPK